MTDKTTKQCSTRAECLEGRIQENIAAQQTDFNAWIFNQIKVCPGSHVLELCCGTGAQTLYFLRRVGNTGRVVAIDISNEALDILRSKVSQKEQASLSLIKSDLDQLDQSLVTNGIPPHPYFDIIFCSYGLYYSKDAKKVLSKLTPWLKPGGSLIIVGPFGPNNEPLFGLLTASGVVISDYIRYTSQDFMNDVVVPFGTLNFNTITIKTLVNKIFWRSKDHVLAYWMNSTFYDNKKNNRVCERLNKHFETEKVLINEKWIMLVIMKNE